MSEHVVTGADDRLHLVQQDSHRIHVLLPDCACGPTIETAMWSDGSTSEVVVHREMIETGGKGGNRVNLG